MSQPIKKRKHFTLDAKFDIIQKYLNGARPFKIENFCEQGSSTVATIIKNKEKIINKFESNLAANGSKRN